MHRVIHGQQGFLSWFECRRTDDSFGRSAALHEKHLRCVENLERLVADVAQAKSRAYWDVVLDITFVNSGLVNRQSRRTDYQGSNLRLISGPGLGHCQDAHNEDGQAADRQQNPGELAGS